jgi:hypothetical protein
MPADKRVLGSSGSDRSKRHCALGGGVGPELNRRDWLGDQEVVHVFARELRDSVKIGGLMTQEYFYLVSVAENSEQSWKAKSTFGVNCFVKGRGVIAIFEYVVLPPHRHAHNDL